jgi:hypothetical protein
MDVFYNQADTAAAGPLAFGRELCVTDRSFNPNLFGSIKAITPFIGDYITVVSNAAHAYVVWGDNRDINPSANAQEDASTATDPPVPVNARSRDSNIYFQKSSSECSILTGQGLSRRNQKSISAAFDTPRPMRVIRAIVATRS